MKDRFCDIYLAAGCKLRGGGESGNRELCFEDLRSSSGSTLWARSASF